MAKIYKGDVGVELVVNVGTDLTDITAHKLIIRKPNKNANKAAVEWQTQIKGEPAEGNLSYIIKEGDLDEVGTYKGYAYIEAGSHKYTGETFQFTVFGPFT